MSAQSLGFEPTLWVRFTSLLAPLSEARLERRQSEVRAKAGWGHFCTQSSCGIVFGNCNTVTL